jgi:hypothetical protein
MADEIDAGAAESPVEDPDAVTSQGEEEEEEDDEGFTFAPATCLSGGGAFGDGRVIGHVYPVFGRPRSPPPKKEEAGTATVRVPLRQLLLAERGSSSPSTQEPDDDDADGELDGVPAETYCLWSPGTSPSASTSPAQFPKSGSTGSVLRWRQRLQVGRSHSDGKEKFVFLQEDPAGSSSTPGRNGRAGGIHSWSYYGRGRGSGRGSRRSSPATFLPYKQDLVGLFANASALRRSYHPF